MNDAPMPGRNLSRAERRQRQTAALKHGAYATTHGQQLRNRRLRGHVSRLKKAYPALADKPVHLLRRYVELDAMSATLWNVLFDEGPLNANGEPKRLLTEYRHLIAELRSLASTLGLLNAPESDADPLSALIRGSR